MRCLSRQFHVQLWQCIIFLLEFNIFSAIESVGLCSKNRVLSGAIIGDGDRKRAPFLVLGLAPWYGTIFLFLEQIAPSPAAHARTLLRRFSRMSRRGNGVRFPKWFMLLAHNPTPLWLLEFWLSIFVVSCSSLSEDSAEFRYVPLYNYRWPSVHPPSWSAAPLTRTSHYSNLNST